MKKKLILASKSMARKKLLEELGIEFSVFPSSYEEEEVVLPPEKLVSLHALKKAREVAKRLKEGLILGVDTLCFLEGKTLGKPSSPKEARKMLEKLSGKTQRVYTALALVDAEAEREMVETVITRVKFKNLTPQEIEAYLNREESMGRAGGYMIQRWGRFLVEKIEGCFFNVIGLPLNKLEEMLKKFGFSLLKGDFDLRKGEF